MRGRSCRQKLARRAEGANFASIFWGRDFLDTPPKTLLGDGDARIDSVCTVQLVAGIKETGLGRRATVL